MPDPFDRGPELAEFQTKLTGPGQARITVPVVDKVFQSIVDIDEHSSAEVSRICDLNHMTANRYVRGEASPRLTVAVRMLAKLGYDLYLVKRK